MRSPVASARIGPSGKTDIQAAGVPAASRHLGPSGEASQESAHKYRGEPRSARMSAGLEQVLLLI